MKTFGVRPNVGVALSCALLLGVVTACGYSTSQVALTNQKFPPRPESHDIEVFRTPPQRPHLELAEIFVQPTPGTASTNTKTPESCIDEFKESARKLGGDAIVIVELTMAPVGTVGAGSFSGQAIAIRWTD